MEPVVEEVKTEEPVIEPVVEGESPPVVVEPKEELSAPVALQEQLDKLQEENNNKQHKINVMDGERSQFSEKINKFEKQNEELVAKIEQMLESKNAEKVSIYGDEDEDGDTPWTKKDQAEWVAKTPEREAAKAEAQTKEVEVWGSFILG